MHCVKRNEPSAVAGNKEQVRLGKFQFHLIRQTLVIGEAERRLSFRESELLKLLYENRNKIIDRKDILNFLWGNDSFFNSRNLDVYISNFAVILKKMNR